MLLLKPGMVWTALDAVSVVQLIGENQAVDKDFLNIKFDILRLEENCVESTQIFRDLLDTIGKLQLDAAIY